jgi:hypothetical protein
VFACLPVLECQRKLADRYFQGSVLKASKLANSDTGHMRHVVFHFVDNNHMSQEWTLRNDQKDAFQENVTYTRVRSVTVP